MTPNRRHAALLTAVLLTALLPSTALAAEPVAVDDPSVDCGNSGFGGAFPIPEDFSGGSPEEFERWFVFIGACSPLANDTDADGDPLAMELVGQPPHGEALVTDGTWLTYRADPDYSTVAGDQPGGDWFSDVITYRALDGGSPSNEAAMRLWIAPINDPPTFTPGPATVEATEDSGEYSAAWATDVAAGPANESGQTVSFEVTDLDVTGVPDLFAVPPAIASDGTLTFTPGPDQFGLASVTVRATDDGGLEDNGMPSGWMDPPDDTGDETTFEIVVWPENDAPVANDDPGAQCGPIENVGGSFLVPEYDPGPAHDPVLWIFGSCAILANDSDVDNDDLSYEILDPPSHGTLTAIDADFLTYEVEQDYGTRPGNVPGGTWVSDSFTYRAFDGVAFSEPATMRFWIAEINDAPSFTPGPDVTVAEDSGPYVAPWASAISVGPESEAWQQLSFDVIEVDVAGGGVLFSSPPIVADDGTLSFTPATSAEGSAVVTIQARDDGGVDDYGIGTPTLYPDDTSDPVTFTITITNQNSPPVADDDSRTVTEDEYLLVRFSVLVNDGDPDSDPLTIIDVSDPTLGTATIDANDIGYTPDPDAFGTDTFTYTVSDGNGGTDSATVSVAITPSNDRPSFTLGPNIVWSEDGGHASFPAWATDVLPGPANEAGQPLTFTVLSMTDSSLFQSAPTMSATGDFAFDPAEDAFGSTDIRINLDDGGGSANNGHPTSVPVTFTVTLSPAQDTPIARDDLKTLFEDASPTSIAVRSNDTDADGDTLSIVATTDGTKGTVEITGGGTALTYRPIADANGSDAFTYTIDDGHGGTASATVAVTVTPVNDGPSVTHDSMTILEDAGPTILPVLSNDSDVEGDTLTINGATSAAKGTVVVAANGTGLSYEPSPNATGPDTFMYTVSDGNGSTTGGVVNLTITAVNDPPVAWNDAASVPSGPASAIPVRANDADVDGDTLTIVATTNGAKGTVAITGGGTGLTYDPAALAVGTDTFTYTVDDGHGGTDIATVTVTIALDTAGPSITAVSESLPGQTIGTNTIRARLTWAGTDAGSGINNYHVQVSINGGAWSGLALPSPTATSLDRTLTIGTSYRFRVRAKDLSGNVGAFREWAAMVPALYQETSSVASYTGAWSTVVNSLASGGATRAATANDRKVTITFIGYDVGWVATRRTSSGAAQVRIDGVLFATVDLDTPTDAYRQLVFARHFSTLAIHTLEIRPVGDGRVDLDAIVVLR